MFRRKSRTYDRSYGRHSVNAGISTPAAAAAAASAGSYMLAPSAAAEALRRHSLDQNGADAIAAFPGYNSGSMNRTLSMTSANGFAAPGGRTSSISNYPRTNSISNFQRTNSISNYPRTNSITRGSQRANSMTRSNSLTRTSTQVNRDRSGRTMSLTTTTVRQMGSFEIITQRELPVSRSARRVGSASNLRSPQPSYRKNYGYADSVHSFDSELAIVEEEPHAMHRNLQSPVASPSGVQYQSSGLNSKPSFDVIEEDGELEYDYPAHESQRPVSPMKPAIRERGSSLAGSEDSRKQRVSFAPPSDTTEFVYDAYDYEDDPEYSENYGYEQPAERAVAAASIAANRAKFRQVPDNGIASQNARAAARARHSAPVPVQAKLPASSSYAFAAASKAPRSAAIGRQRGIDIENYYIPDTNAVEHVNMVDQPSSRLPSEDVYVREVVEDDSIPVEAITGLANSDGSPEVVTGTDNLVKSGQKTEIAVDSGDSVYSDPIDPESDYDSAHSSIYSPSTPEPPTDEKARFLAHSQQPPSCVISQRQPQERVSRLDPGVRPQGAGAAGAKHPGPSYTAQRSATNCASQGPRAERNSQFFPPGGRVNVRPQGPQSPALVYSPQGDAARAAARPQVRQVHQPAPNGNVEDKPQQPHHYRSLLGNYASTANVDDDEDSDNSASSFKRSPSKKGSFKSSLDGNRTYSLRNNGGGPRTNRRASLTQSPATQSRPRNGGPVGAPNRTYSLRNTPGPDPRRLLADAGNRHDYIMSLRDGADGRPREPGLFKRASKAFNSRINESDSDDGGPALPRPARGGHSETSGHPKTGGKLSFKEMFSPSSDARQLLPGHKHDEPLRQNFSPPTEQKKSKGLFKKLLGISVK